MTSPSSSRGTSDFRLTPLDCPTCGAALAAAGEDVVFYCTACRNGYRYQSEEPHLSKLEVQFVAASNIAAERYLPFWVLEAHVDLGSRRAGRKMPSLLQAAFGGKGASSVGDVEFAVPAFQVDLDSTVELTQRYTRELPGLGERIGERLIGGCYGVEDARTLAHFAVIAGEVDKPDTLRYLEYSIRFGGSRLLGVPFAREGDTWKDAVFGIRALKLESP